MKKLTLKWILFLLAALFATCYAETLETANNKAINFAIQATSIDLQNTQLSLAQVEQSIRDTKENLRDYQEQYQALSIGKANDDQNFRKTILAAKIQNQKTFLKLNEQRRTTLQITLNALNTQLTNEQQNLSAISEAQNRASRLAHEAAVKQEIQTLSDEQNYWLNQITILNQTLSKNKNAAQGESYASLLQQIFTAEENSNLTQFKINLLHANNSIQSAATNINETASATQLYEVRQVLSDTIDVLQQTQAILSQKADLLQKREDLLNNKNLPPEAHLGKQSQIQAFLKQYQDLSTNVTTLLTQATHQQEKATALLAKALAHRQGLPGFNAEEWLLLSKSLLQTLVMTYQLAIVTCRDALSNLHQMSGLKEIKIFALPMLAVGAYFILRILTKKIKQKLSTTPDNILHRFLDGVLRIFIAHLWFIILLFVGFAFLTILNISTQTTDLFFNVGNTILIYSIAMMSAKIALYENLATHSGDDVKLYHRLIWLFSFGFIIALLMILSKGLNSPYEAQDLFNRLFMAFIFIIALMLLKAWRVLPEIIIGSVNPQRHYLIRSTQLLGLLIPLIILSNAVIGLVGFVELAWTISKYEGLFLLVAVTYLIARGLMNDGLNALADRLIRMRSGWIYTEAFLKPLSIWLHIFLALLSLYLLLYLYGLNNQAFLINYFHKAMRFPLIRFSSHSITLWILIKAIIVGSFSIWATKWSREFFYRKLYRNVRDIGARNSLAIFSRYGVFVLGLILTLKTLQVDLTALGYILSGFALGAGFGLRDLANNFVSGLLILIERPMRRGDTVTIGDYEGKVINIGIRATSLLSGDNREVVVPNSEVFSKIFTNWTHQDDIVRCETSLKVRWQNDPHQLQKVIEGIMQTTKGVLPKPAPQAILKSLNDGLLEFVLRFYIDYRANDSRIGMQSKILFNLWDKFAELGVQPPYPAQRVFLSKEDEK